jgi:CDP-2,3-bis-(O-geranylgeranyl)-sn-glycerol synthase
MSHDILFSLWFFIPAGIANSTPIIAAHLPVLRTWSAPLDFHKQFRGKRILGDHKTIRGVIVGALMGVLAIWLQSQLFHDYTWVAHISSPVSYGSNTVALLGLLLGIGALFGDATKSFFKRQYNIDEGRSWFPFDQLDYVIGGLLLSSFYVRLPAADYGLIVVIWFGMHLLFSYIGFLLKLKELPL